MSCGVQISISWHTLLTWRKLTLVHHSLPTEISHLLLKGWTATLGNGLPDAVETPCVETSLPNSYHSALNNGKKAFTFTKNWMWRYLNGREHGHCNQNTSVTQGTWQHHGSPRIDLACAPAYDSGPWHAVSTWPSAFRSSLLPVSMHSLRFFWKVDADSRSAALSQSQTLGRASSLFGRSAPCTGDSGQDTWQQQNSAYTGSSNSIVNCRLFHSFDTWLLFQGTGYYHYVGEESSILFLSLHRDI